MIHRYYDSEGSFGTKNVTQSKSQATARNFQELKENFSCQKNSKKVKTFNQFI